MSYARSRPGTGSLNVSLTGELRPILGYSEEGGPRLACLDDPNLWFPDAGDTEAAAQAKAACMFCPVRDRCLERNLETPEGIFGGFDTMERRMLREGVARCTDCNKLVPATMTVCVPCSKERSKAKERAKAARRKKEGKR